MSASTPCSFLASRTTAPPSRPGQSLPTRRGGTAAPLRPRPCPLPGPPPRQQVPSAGSGAWSRGRAAAIEPEHSKVHSLFWPPPATALKPRWPVASPSLPYYDRSPLPLGTAVLLTIKGRAAPPLGLPWHLDPAATTSGVQRTGSRPSPWPPMVTGPGLRAHHPAAAPGSLPLVPLFPGPGAKPKTGLLLPLVKMPCPEIFS